MSRTEFTELTDGPRSRVLPVTPTAETSAAPSVPWWLRAIGAISGAVGRDDLIVLIGLLLWAYGFRDDLRYALGGPAIVLVWYGLPARPGFFTVPRERR